MAYDYSTAKLKWDVDGTRLYETGVSNVVLYTKGNDKKYGKATAWSGVTNITESPSGADETPIYADNIKYLSLRAREEFGATIEAYSYPDEWAACDGSAELTPGVRMGQQTRQSFGLAFKTLLGNDEVHDDYGYKLHLIYGGTASPSERAYATVNDSPEAITFSWEVSTIPEAVAGFKPTANLVITVTPENAATVEKLEKVLFGDSTEATPYLPLPDEVKTILTAGN